MITTQLDDIVQNFESQVIFKSIMIEKMTSVHLF